MHEIGPQGSNHHMFGDRYKSNNAKKEHLRGNLFLGTPMNGCLQTSSDINFTKNFYICVYKKKISRSPIFWSNPRGFFIGNHFDLSYGFFVHVILQTF